MRATSCMCATPYTAWERYGLRPGAMPSEGCMESKEETQFLGADAVAIQPARTSHQTSQPALHCPTARRTPKDKKTTRPSPTACPPQSTFFGTRATLTLLNRQPRPLARAVVAVPPGVALAEAKDAKAARAALVGAQVLQRYVAQRPGHAIQEAARAPVLQKREGGERHQGRKNRQDRFNC